MKKTLVLAAVLTGSLAAAQMQGMSQQGGHMMPMGQPAQGGQPTLPMQGNQHGMPMQGAQQGVPAQQGGVDHAAHHQGTPAMQALEKLSGRAFDAAWMSQMIGHHEIAVIMSAIQLAHGKRADVRALARKIIEAQTREMDLMHSFLRKWSGANASSAHLMLQMQEMSGMLKSMQDGAMGNTDRVFLQLMIPHHASAIAMARLAEARASKPELKRLARQVITDQAREIKTFEALLARGY
ncbi:MAG TPA: DUF305 domain-containing protein [Deinococcales bacterium]|nr:DUF305 domain-containing protein [Deinococcales bacterium]